VLSGQAAIAGTRTGDFLRFPRRQLASGGLCSNADGSHLRSLGRNINDTLARRPAHCRDNVWASVSNGSSAAILTARQPNGNRLAASIEKCL
jgi:hypothetical protein